VVRYHQSMQGTATSCSTLWSESEIHKFGLQVCHGHGERRSLVHYTAPGPSQPPTCFSHVGVCRPGVVRVRQCLDGVKVGVKFL
jgi:hypothetical protein